MPCVLHVLNLILKNSSTYIPYLNQIIALSKEMRKSTNFGDYNENNNFKRNIIKFKKTRWTSIMEVIIQMEDFLPQYCKFLDLNNLKNPPNVKEITTLCRSGSSFFKKMKSIYEFFQSADENPIFFILWGFNSILNELEKLDDSIFKDFKKNYKYQYYFYWEKKPHLMSSF